MRPIIKSLLYTCAVCAVAQGPAARAQPAPQPGETPSTQPNPDQPPPPPDQPPITQDQTPPPDTTTDTTTTSTTTITPVTPVTPVPVDDTGTPVMVDPGVPDPYSYTWRDGTLPSGIGVSTILGGGVVGFTDRTMRDTTSDVGGMWDLRVTIGSHIPLALDLSYLGTATNINALPTGQNGTLIGTTLEGAVRFNALPHHTVNPYVFAGVGWQRYDVTETNVSLSDSGMNDMDNLVEFPMGAGLSYRRNGFVGDLRGTFRATTEENLVLKTSLSPPASPTTDDFAPMHTWEASAALGYEF